MAIIKIMRLISLPDPGHICGRREKRKGNGMERDENATGKRILFRLSAATPCNVNKQNKKTCPLFCSGSLPRCYINAWLFFSVWCHCTLGTMNRFAATEHVFIIY